MKVVVDTKGESQTAAYQKFAAIHNDGYNRVCDEWHTFSVFKAWWEANRTADNNTLVAINREFSPETCGFVSAGLKWVFNYVKNGAGTQPVSGGYVVSFRSKVHTDLYPTKDEAHAAYIKMRNEYIDTLKPQLPEHLRSLVGTKNTTGTRPVYSAEQDLNLASGYIAKAQSSAGRGIEFTLTFDKYRELVTSMSCHITSAVFVEHDKKHPRSRTLDRLDCNGPYSNENTVAITHEANAMKNVIAEHPSGTMDADCFKKLADYITSNQQIIDNMNFRGAK